MSSIIATCKACQHMQVVHVTPKATGSTWKCALCDAKNKIYADERY